MRWPFDFQFTIDDGSTLLTTGLQLGNWDCRANLRFARNDTKILTTKHNCFSWAEEFVSDSSPADSSAEGGRDNKK